MARPAFPLIYRKSQTRQAPMRFSFPVPVLRRLAVFGLAVWTTFGGPSRAAAQSSAMDDTDKKALVEYKLTLERVDKVGTICRKIIEAAKVDPQIGKEMQALKEDQNGTFEQINGVFTKQAPHVLAIIKGEGLDPREYMLGLLSTMFARMAAGVKASGSTDLPDFIPPANIELAEKNKAKFEDANKAIGDMDAVGRAPRL